MAEPPTTQLAPSERTVVTVGTYDGVHLGHRRLIEETKADAAVLGLPSVVVTFSEHPSSVLRPDRPVELLCTLEEKLELLAATGVDRVEVLTFDHERAIESAEEFVRVELVERLHVAEVLVGSNFRFGYRRLGDVALLEALGQRYGFSARGIDLVLDDEHRSVVSSTRIRSLLSTGEILKARQLLGRAYRLSGMLDEKGRLLSSPELLVPPPGRYRCEVVDVGGNGPSLLTFVVVEPSREVRVELVAPAAAPSLRVAVSFVGDREPAV